MLVLLYEWLKGWLNAHGMGWTRVVADPTFRSMLCLPVAFLIMLLVAPRFIRWLVKQKIGDNPNFDQPDINDLMAMKKNTPTMGGVLIIAAIVGTVLLLGDLRSFYVRMALLVTVYLGALGAIDDWLKLTKHRRGATDRQGLRSLEKLLFQIGLGVLIGYFTYRHGEPFVQNVTLYVPFFKNASIVLGAVAFVAIATVVLTGTSNAVNLTDGLDGLAAGCMAIVSFTFFILATIIGTTVELKDRPLAEGLFLPHIEGSVEMAVVAAALCGACIGFLWFNCFPAKVFMGDTGSLAIGGLLGYIAIVVRQEVLLFLVGGVFVAEAVSVMMQVSYFKLTRKMTGTGRRIFLMSPLHHHFQKKGWPEPRVVVRFWMITAMLAAMALATVKLR
ncbi:MAG TPA: phospho-N-acetylmuramoyl-pentapeptide-transferase [Tepidisphaeraceae bacterium]|nr:phospho-N-acetylmuramoyl-pentapeptide-transferase [Tepidisphaeraceae bacterium]